MKSEEEIRKRLHQLEHPSLVHPSVDWEEQRQAQIQILKWVLGEGEIK